MDSASENDSDFEFESESDSEDDVPQPSNRIWTNVGYVHDFEYPHAIRPFSRHMGPVNPPDVEAPPVEYFNKLSVPDVGRSLIDILVQETNRYAGQVLSSQRDPKPYSRNHKWSDTNHSEMSAYLGLYLSMGILKKPSIESYWQESPWLFRSPAYPEVMTRDRFQIISKFLHCNDNATYVPRGTPGYDPAHKFRPVLDLINSTFPKAYDLARDLTIDESMVGFKGRNDIVQYVPAKKSHQWGAKLFVLAESDTGYNAAVQLYAGRQQDDPRSVHGVGYVIMQLIQPYLYRHHHVVCDNYFTSAALCDVLFESDTYMTGTVRVCRKGMPRSLRGLKLQRGESVVKQSGPIMTLCYGDRKTVTFMSTLSKPNIISTQNARGVEVDVPEVNLVYNKEMGGVDLSDKSLELYDPDVRSNKMWKKILINFLLRILSNAYIIYRQNRGLRIKMSRIDFYMMVCMGLIGDFSQEKRQTGRSSLCPLARLRERHFIEQMDEIGKFDNAKAEVLPFAIK
ncbi:piggyBac transposable element-derived protein 4-like [Saccostrea echinata]|uniref:piggyBac transposable element-derived protein 4-like n=1 Tax=Saccostrea echinata TaxID=191078 RepID=UPI002A82D4AC|nr:piggyBac transposable element-derived protein 4-like [Saccostrea echinata]